MSDVERMADRLVMIHDAQLWLDSAVDEVREGYCLALLPADLPDARSRLLAIDSCLSVRERDGGWRAIFASPPERCEAMLTETLGEPRIRCVKVGLEEMFIELVGGGS